MNILETMLLLAGIAVSGAGVVALIRANQSLKNLISK